MKKLTILRNPVDLHDVSIDDLYDDSDSWQLKAERLIQRRQKRLRLNNA
jgi:hypothetical protein